MNREEQILQILQQNPNLSNREIGKIVGCHRSTVAYYLHKLGIFRDRLQLQKLNNTNRNSNIVISDAAKQILIGTLLGDSHITKYNRNCESVKILNSCISCGHSIKQKEYVQYLKSLLESENIKVNYRENTKRTSRIIDGRIVETVGRCDLSTIRNIQFNSWRDLWYPNNTKVIPREIADIFSALSLAIWYMDDGSKNNCSYYLHTEGFSLGDIRFLQKLLLSKFNLHTEVHHNRGKNLIYIKARSRELFTTIIKPYICDSMKYKIIEHNIGSE